jgi:hypothetical protein
MRPIIVTKDADGKITFTEDELVKLLEEAYQNGYDIGYKEGKASATPITVPSYPSYPTWLNPTVDKTPPWLEPNLTTWAAVNGNKQ